LEFLIFGTAAKLAAEKIAAQGGGHFLQPSVVRLACFPPHFHVAPSL
jgi:hypothetical protein